MKLATAGSIQGVITPGRADCTGTHSLAPHARKLDRDPCGRGHANRCHLHVPRTAVKHLLACYRQLACVVGLTYPYTYLHAHCALSQTYSVDDSARACRLVEDVYASFVAVHVVDLFESAPSGGFENEMITNSDMSHVAITPVNEASQRGCVFTRPDVACKLKRRLYPLFHCYLHPLLHLFGHAGRAYPVRARSSVSTRCLMK